jgi:3-phosphoshikimate 1-carboxyvinyltransferase
VGAFDVPASKSILQRALALAALGEGEVALVTATGAPALEGAGTDVADLARALASLGRWQAGALGHDRRSRTLDLGLGATGFRLAAALATLRPAGARTLLRGRPGLLARPHGDLRRALLRLGAHVVRKPSGALRVIAGGVHGGTLAVGCRRTSQHVSALMLVAPRLGGLELTLVDRPVSTPYLKVTAAVLGAFGIGVGAEGLEAPGGRIRVEGGAPACSRFVVEPDASAATFWWAAAALTGGRAWVRGLPRASAQADVLLLGVLERMGARVDTTPSGEARVEGPERGLVAAGEVDLEDAPDLLPVVAALAARARGRTSIVGVAHARLKESDRLAGVARLLGALGGQVTAGEGGIVVDGGGLHAAEVGAAGDHRLAFMAALLGLGTPGIVLRGAEAVAKSHPGLWTDLGGAWEG